MPGRRSKDETHLLCPICSRNLLEDFEDAEFIATYRGLVCRECDARALNVEGKTLGASGVYFEGGDNPVFIDSQKCWRRYRFGGHVTMVENSK